MKPTTTKSTTRLTPAPDRKKRNLDNTVLNGFFGKGPKNIWEKDIKTGEGNFDA
ncbi:hypothetical protein [Fibrella aquatica]|jgi:hypothetical protein|uniref:hypothetical protein n=1 Tax=Fibrella aquatica TaxID=3242487 RepID=UPI00351F83A9